MRYTIGITALAGVLAAPALAQTLLQVQLPGGRNAVTVALDAENWRTYTVPRDARVILAFSHNMLELADDRIGYGRAIVGADRRKAEQTYRIAAGPVIEGRGHNRESVVHFTKVETEPRQMNMALRSYDGVTSRTVLSVQPHTAATVELPLAALGPALAIDRRTSGAVPDTMLPESSRVDTRRPLRLRLAPSGGGALILRGASQ